MAEYPDNITTEHPLYENRSAAWTLVAAAYNGGSDFITDEYIIQHVFEDENSFNKRVERAFYFNIVRRTVGQLVRTIVSEGVVRAGLESIAPVLSDATGFGTSWGSFFEDAGVASMLFGNAHILIDFAESANGESEVTEAMVEDEEIDAYPSLELYTPLEMINWQKTRRKGYEWCVFKVTKVVDGRSQEVYIKVDSQQIEEVLQDGTVVSAAYAHGLGYTPVIDVPFPGMHKEGLHQGLGTDLAYNAKGILNLTSLTEEAAERSAFNQLVIPDDGAIEEMQARQSDYIDYEITPEVYDMLAQGQDPVLKQLSKSNVTTFPAGTGHPPGFISPDSAQLSSIWEVVMGALKTSMYSAGLTDLSGALDVEAIQGMLNGLSQILQRAEFVAANVVAKYASATLDAEAVVLYPTSYSSGEFSAWLANFAAVAGMQSVDDDFKLKLLQRQVYAMPGQITQVEKEVLAGSLTLVVQEPESGFGPDSEDGGNSNSAGNQQ